MTAEKATNLESVANTAAEQFSKFTSEEQNVILPKLISSVLKLRKERMTELQREISLLQTKIEDLQVQYNQEKALIDELNESLIDD